MDNQEVKQELPEEQVMANVDQVTEKMRKSGAVFLSICIVPDSNPPKIKTYIPSNLTLASDLLVKLNAMINSIVMQQLQPPQQRIVRPVDPGWRQKVNQATRIFLGRK